MTDDIKKRKKDCGVANGHLGWLRWGMADGNDDWQ